MKKFLTSLFLIAGISFSASALDLTFRLNPNIMIPLNPSYSTGFGANAQADVDLFGFLTVGVEGNFVFDNIAIVDDDIYMVGGGIGAGAYYYPLSRLYLGAGGAFGIYQFTVMGDDQDTASDFYYRAYGEVGFRFSPSFTLSGTAGFNSYLLHESDPFFNGISTGVSLRYTVPIGKKGSSSFITSVTQEDAAFPLFMSAYRNSPLGTFTLRNNEGAEIKNVHISFRAGKYTASTYESAVIPRINKYSTIEVPLYADFSGEILKYCENGKISGEVVIDYEFLGKKMQVVENAVISVYNRNAFSWADSTALASFISPNTPEILSLARNIAGIARLNFYTGMNRNVQMAAAMTEGIRLVGVRYNEDKVTPYVEKHTGYELDSIQYPLQTLNVMGGDYDDMGVLLASCLESVGVATGYLPLADDFIVLVSAGIKPGAEANSFGDVNGLIVDDENVFFGISMKNLHKGFGPARAAASKAIAAALADENAVIEYTNVHAAWDVYTPCAFRENGENYDMPGQRELTANMKIAVKDYMDTDLTKVLARARKTGDSNKIGVALMRLGRYSEAKTEFSKSGTKSAMNNLATVYMIEKNYSAAANTYKAVLAKDPENRIAKKGLENANAKLGL